MSGEQLHGLPLRPLEAAFGYPIGAEEQPIARLGGDPAVEPVDTLIAELAHVLAAGPCYVSFSGGRDSSVVLALATAAARRHGLPPPIPITLRFAEVASTVETEWQELVIDHLGIDSWQVITIGEELDLLGPIACKLLRKHGLLWPPNCHFHVPMLAQATGGSLLTGFDGDGLFGAWPWARLQAVLHRRVRPTWRDGRRIVHGAAPRQLRRRVVKVPLIAACSWLTPQAAAEIRRIIVEHNVQEPKRWNRRVSYYLGSRYLRFVVHSLRALGQSHGVQVVHPLLDRRFLGALATAGGSAGYGDRTAAVRELFGDLIPEGTVSRRSKAEFGRAFWRAGARSFAERWDGTGFDPELVDGERLREAWRAENPVFGASTLLQAAWLSAESR